MAAEYADHESRLGEVERQLQEVRQGLPWQIVAVGTAVSQVQDDVRAIRDTQAEHTETLAEILRRLPAEPA